ncbi:CG6767 [Drosophila busckii]|uniref:ribose-phosphate diphosphokinase n=1 Tax=Drosophila busckii TaxID=30019 RepID=A0A0M5IYL2_DROBS|nr:ribose-phosphate pyrophosphokinase 2 [Drosophila busckii]ALC38698.1 CG6767 [Drosophila busckii]
MRLMLVAGSSHGHFTQLLARYLGTEPLQATRNKYANGETRFELLESVSGGDVYLVQTSADPVNDSLMELLLMAQTCRYASAQRITAVMPCFPYARQDKMKGWQQPISAKLVANLLQAAGVHQVLTMHLHAPQLQGFFDIPCENLSSQLLLVAWIQQYVPDWRQAVIVAPDNGAVKLATSISEQLSIPLALLHKQRNFSNEIEHMLLVGDVAHKVSIVVDDMVDTGNTLCFAAQHLLEAGATKIYGCVTHGVFTGQSLEKLLQAPYELFACTNSLPLPERVQRERRIHIIDVTSIFARHIQKKNSPNFMIKMQRAPTSELFDVDDLESSKNAQGEKSVQTRPHGTRRVSSK